MKSSSHLCKSFWLLGYKPCSSVEGVRNEKMKNQIHKDFHPDMGCSGSLNPTVTVNLVNVGTSCLGLRTGLTAIEVRHEGRESRSSRNQGKPDTWRRTQADVRYYGWYGRKVGLSSRLLALRSSHRGEAVCDESRMHGFDAGECETR